MRVAELIAPRRFRLVEGQTGEPGAGEVQVRVRAVGICGSDLHNFSEGGIGDRPCLFPMVLGHEPAGTVLKTGAGVTGWAPGDTALLEPALYCYHCEFCATGRHNLCVNMRFLSNPGAPGFFREVVTLPAKNLLPVPPGVGLAAATLFEPLAVVLHSMKFARPERGETAAVYGCGPIGLLTVAVLALSGAGRIFAVDPVAHRREMALALGAACALDPSAGAPSAEIGRATGQRGADLAIDCAAKADSTNECLRALRPGGRLVLTGIPSEVLVPLELHVMRRKEIALFNVHRSNHETGEAAELLREHPARFGSIVTHQRPLEQVEAAFSMLERYDDGVGKVVIDLS